MRGRFLVISRPDLPERARNRPSSLAFELCLALHEKSFAGPLLCATSLFCASVVVFLINRASHQKVNDNRRFGFAACCALKVILSFQRNGFAACCEDGLGPSVAELLIRTGYALCFAVCANELTSFEGHSPK